MVNNATGSLSGGATFFLLDGFGVDEPLRFASAAWLLALHSGQSANFQKPADVRTCSVENDCSFLRSEPAGMAVGHPNFSSGGFAVGGSVHFSGSVVFLAMEKMHCRGLVLVLSDASSSTGNFPADEVLEIVHLIAKRV